MACQRMICRECDLAVNACDLEAHHDAFCPRCNHRLKRGSYVSLQGLLALSVTGLLLLIPTLTEPLLSIRMLGQYTEASIVTGSVLIMEAGFPLVGLVVLACSIMIPGLVLFLVTVMLLLVQRGLPSALGCQLLKVYQWLHTWSLLEVYLISFFVTVFKMRDFAVISPGLGLVSLVILVVLELYITSELDRERLWRSFAPVGGRV